MFALWFSVSVNAACCVCSFLSLYFGKKWASLKESWSCSQNVLVLKAKWHLYCISGRAPWWQGAIYNELQKQKLIQSFLDLFYQDWLPLKFTVHFSSAYLCFFFRIVLEVNLIQTFKHYDSLQLLLTFFCNLQRVVFHSNHPDATYD